MRRKRNSIKQLIIENLLITAIGSEGNALGRYEDKVIFVPFAAPGDLVDVKVIRSKKSYAQASIIRFHQKSSIRKEPPCQHFGVCGGCKWQHVDYADQLEAKQQQVLDNLLRLGNITAAVNSPILGCVPIYHYRNKLEYTFSAHRWLLPGEMAEAASEPPPPALGFHISGFFDKVLPIQCCHLQAEPSNEIRLWIEAYAKEAGIDFYNSRTHSGSLRNLLLRNNLAGEWMVVLVLGVGLNPELTELLHALRKSFPQIVSLFYVVNLKHNDSLSDQQAVLFSGQDCLMEKLGNTRYRISPLSFFQTNTYQALELYNKVKELAGFKGDETVYDLYSGTGSIALFIAPYVKNVIGVEYVDSAVEDARMNAELNAVDNAVFVAGDLSKMFNAEFVSQFQVPDVIITDPPRAGMHEKVVEQILALAPEKIIYVSCNPATQARDLQLMAQNYDLNTTQPVDMFPHTHHVENIALLVRKKI